MLTSLPGNICGVDTSYMKFLDLINCSDCDIRVCDKSKAVFVDFSVERTHVLDLKS